MNVFKKRQKKENNKLKNKLSEVGFPNFWPLEVKMEYSGPEIRILREISSPEPAGNVISPQSRLKSGQIWSPGKIPGKIK